MELSPKVPQSSLLPTLGQFEREISQKVYAFFRDSLGQRPSKVSAQIFGTKVVLVLEDTATKPEQLLIKEGKDQLAKKVREDLHQVLRPEIKTLIEKILSVDVIDILSDSTLDSGRFGIIVILAEAPKYRQK